MKRYQSTLTKMTRPVCMALAALLMVGAMASCSENENTETAQSDNAYLSLSFSTGTGNSTRAGETSGKALADNETDANPTQENDIHNIKVWVFKSNTGDEATPISYKAETLSEVKNGNYTLNLRFLRKIGGEEVKNIDLYILANSESINMLDQMKGKDLSSVTRKDLKEVSFTSPFGINSDGTAETKDVPAGKGLPISRAITQISVDSHVADTEEGAKDKGIKIPLVRAVSKLHFYFARKSGNDANTSQVKVTRIEVEGNTIPTASYVFPDEATYNEDGYNQNVTSQKYDNAGTAYVPTTLKLAGVENKDIREVDNPESFIKKSNQSAQEYLDAFDNKGIKSHDLCYLRETTKAIKGTIYYSLDGGATEKHETFNIASEGNAIRNRELVVYGYFLNGQMGKLTVTPTIQEWQDGGTFDFIDASTNVVIPDKDQTAWGYKVYYGFPKLGPMITLEDIDTKGKPWILQTDNPMFGFVQCDKNGYYEEKEPVYDPIISDQNDGNKIIGYTYHIDDYIINKSGKKDTLYFYVVPKSRLDLAKPHNVKAHVFLTTYPNDKFILNPGFKYKGCKEGKFAGKDIHFEQVL
ncbi:hypothetical protein [Segatella copri]|jgi:hypothetical protein|uniref:Major fimbrial subunit protein N-terminal domain-containing protein n=1 Tax=Segatella copri TaxID=165179 RepID=A0AAW5I4M9_9BACT|nr:hypothetical protein [Segatella copri]MCF0067361.1 hypothetical protein [Segatella copri]MCP9459155.1 hypothetical protein [Segatella copri]MCP9501519.1 hypothetical protein [Segatella copri]MCP9504298.1 hypothetical protein [Segatella copri]MCP9507561.1 hypothetical protein [Segatella copri]